ncbi:hypothetical protein CO046_00090 [Candidatus Peregrinibacteria bacterium CG_4_9_14_0_2_um_filter_53_11]|nr:MAG: hypothetical protein CO046_00090 [Candidatus Peregrinibacteria bacterium CG_4_9_14_0_2_um_filter_53_11]
MQTAFSFKNVSALEQAQFEEYVAGKLAQIEKLLTHFSPDAVRLELRLEKFDKHSAFLVEYILRANSDTLKASETSHAITKAVDLAKDRLELQIKKMTEQSRRNHRGIKAHTLITAEEEVMEL